MITIKQNNDIFSGVVVVVVGIERRAEKTNAFPELNAPTMIWYHKRWIFSAQHLCHHVLLSTVTMFCCQLLCWLTTFRPLVAMWFDQTQHIPLHRHTHTWLWIVARPTQTYISYSLLVLLCFFLFNPLPLGEFTSYRQRNYHFSAGSIFQELDCKMRCSAFLFYVFFCIPVHFAGFFRRTHGHSPNSCGVFYLMSGDVYNNFFYDSKHNKKA